MKKHIVKRIFAGICGAMLLFSLAGCGNHQNTSSSTVVDLTNSPVAIANRYVDAITNPDGVDAQAIVDMMPDQIIDYAVANDYVSNEQELVDIFTPIFDIGIGDRLDYVESSYDSAYEFHIGDATPVSASELEAIQEIYQEFGIEVSEAQTVPIVWSVSHLGEERDFPEDLITIKVDDTWCLNVLYNNASSGTGQNSGSAIISSNANPTSSNSPEGVAQRYTNAILNHDETSGQTILDLLPDQLTNEMISQGSFSNEAELAEYLTSSMDSVTEAFEHMEEQGVECQIKERTSAPVSESELSAIQEAYQEYDIDVSEAQTATIVLELTYEGQSSEQPMDVPVVKIDNDWYLDAYSMSK